MNALTAAPHSLAALVLACAVCAAAPSGARGELPLSSDEENRAPRLEKTVLASEIGAVGNLSACINEECRRSCTAFLIGPDLAATSAHCVKIEDGNWHDPARIRFHSYDISRHAAVRAVEFVHAGDFKRTSDSDIRGYFRHVGQDIAILRLEERIGDKLGWLPKGEVNWDKLAGGEYEIVGMLNNRQIHMQQCRIHPEIARLWTKEYTNLRSAYEKGAFFHSCHMRGGFSGSPLLRRENGELKWIGVNSSGMSIDQAGYHTISNAGMTAILLPGGNPAPAE